MTPLRPSVPVLRKPIRPSSGILFFIGSSFLLQVVPFSEPSLSLTLAFSPLSSFLSCLSLSRM